MFTFKVDYLFNWFVDYFLKRRPGGNDFSLGIPVPLVTAYASAYHIY